MTEPNPVILQRFMSKVEISESGCWEWLAAKTPEYGAFHIGGRQYRAHRLAYEWFVGPIPEGLVVHHRCRNPGCVNPDHLEPLTAADNLRLQDHPERRKTHCPQGHAYDEANTYVDRRGHRHCRVCKRTRAEALRGYRPIPRPEYRTHCPRGHPYDEENTIIRKGGSRLCRTCNRYTCSEYRAMRKRLGTLPKGH